MSSTEDVLIKNAEFFITLIKNGSTEEKSANIIELLNEGANLNERFANNCNNTPLHIAVRKEEEEIVKLCLEKGADTTLKNNEGKTALDTAKELNTETGLRIIEMFETYNKNLQTPYKKVNLLRNVSIENVGTDNLSLYQKRAGTTGIKGELYETKLLSLILIRTILNQNIDQFYLGTSVQGIGALDDICFRFKENDKESVVFLQAKHIIKGKIKLKDLWKKTGNYGLPKYFNSYLKIKQKFESTSKDSLVQGRYEDTRCHFVIYTTAEDEISGKKILNKHSADKRVREIISTGKNCHVFQYKYDTADIKLLTKVILVERMQQIGKNLFQFTRGNKYKNMLRDKHIRNYHVVLAQNVIAVSEIAVDDARIGSFRDEFLSSNNELLIVLKETLFKEAVTDTKISDDNLIRIVDLALFQPTANNISNLIQNVPTSYDLKNNRLEIFNNTIKEFFSSSLHETVISHTTFNEAFQIAVKEKLGAINFRLPLTFGNLDIKVNGLDVENTLNDIALKIENILLRFGHNNITINTKDKFDLSLIGNVLVYDEDNSMFKFNTCVESVGQNANNVLNKLKTKVKDLDSYRFQFNTDKIPKISFEADESDYRLAKDFLNNLWFYTRQAKEHEIEEYARDVLEEYYHTIKQKPYNTFSHVQSDAIFLKIHNEIQKWWLLETTQAYYITKNMQIYDKILNDLPSNNLLSILNYIYVNDIQKYGIDFSEKAVQSLGLDTLTALTVIETGNKTLTAVKLYQYFGQKNNYTFIDLNYASCLSVQDNEILLRELAENDKEIIIIIHEHISNDVINLNKLLNSSVTKKIILVINGNCREKLINRTKIKEHVIVRDEKTQLQDLTVSSQTNILEKKLQFQGMEVSFETIIDADSQRLISEKLLKAIINNETIEIGKILSTSNYEQIKDYYVQRCLYRSKVSKICNEMRLQLSSSEDDESSSQVQNEVIKIKTLEDIKGTVVLLAAPGMGKSTLLTHLSIETKKNNPRLWIERVNLLDHTSEFYKWQGYNIKIDLLEALRFLCKNIVMAKYSRKQNVNMNNEKLNFNIEVTDGVVSLKHCNELDYLNLLELEIFVDCYNKRNAILIFDGFDEICPHYKSKVLELLKCLAFKTFPKQSDVSTDHLEVKQHMWITSRPYNDVKKTLETEFGISYSLKPFTDDEQHFFVEKYLRINLNLKDLDYQQFQNIDSLFEYMIQFSDLHKDMNEIVLIKSTSAPLHSLYSAAIVYLQSEIRNTPISADKVMFTDKWNSNIRWLKASELLATWNHVSEEAMNLARTPLHMYIALYYFETQVKHSDNIPPTHQWDLDTNTFAFYENFLETKLKKIRFEEKNGMDLQNPDLRLTYERERFEFVTKHKQLAFYSIFKDEANKIFQSRGIHTIKNTIRRIENGEEKTGLIEYVINGVPKFVHLTFAEYLAVEFIADLLKTDAYEDQVKIWEFILYVVLPKSSTGVLEIFDRKVNCDPKLLDIISGLDLNQSIIDDFINNDPYVGICPNFSNFSEMSLYSRQYVKTTLDIAVYYGMKNLAQLLLAVITEKLTEENLNQFIKFVKYQYFFKLSIKYGYNEILELVINCVRRVDSKKLYKLYYLPNRRDPRIPLFGCSNEEIIDYLKTNLSFDVELYGREQQKDSAHVFIARKKTYKRYKMKKIMHDHESSQQ